MANLKETCQEVRRLILGSSYLAKACHIGSALSCVEILVVLYWKILKKNDIFLFSKASGVSALYTILALKKRIPIEHLPDILKLYPLASKEVSGVIYSVGSLGHGLPVAVGLALANRKRRVYVLMSDAELQEGTTWESALFAGHHQLKNLVVMVDKNNLQACGNTEDILRLKDLESKFQNFGFATTIQDGNDYNKVWGTLSTIPKVNTPKLIVFRTIKGRGVSFMENNYEWHYRNLDEGLLRNALEQIKWNTNV